MGTLHDVEGGSDTYANMWSIADTYSRGLDCHAHERKGSARQELLIRFAKKEGLRTQFPYAATERNGGQFSSHRLVGEWKEGNALTPTRTTSV